MEGWETKTLDEACIFINGLWKGKKPPFINVGVFRNTNFTIDGGLDDSNIAYLDIETKMFKSRKLQYGDIILEKSGGGPKQAVGRVALFEKQNGDYSFSNFTAAVRVRQPEKIGFRYLHKYLYWKYLSGTTETMQSHSTGIRNLNNNAYKAIKITYPSPIEQQRIVAILDESFKGIAKAKANAEKNIQNARELFRSYLNIVFTQRGEGWMERKLGDICTLKSGSTINSVLETPTGDIPYLKVADMNQAGNNIRIVSSSRFLKAADTVDSAIMPPGTTIFPKRGGAIMTNKKRLTAVPICADSNIMGVIPSKALVPEYLYFYFLQVDMRQLGSGSSIPQINNYDIEPLTIAYPISAAKQKEVAGMLNKLQGESSHLESIYQQKLAALDELKQSLLEQAFSGQL